MADKRFDIVVQDKVARTIRTELQGIGASAKSAYADLKLLNGEMGRGAATAASQAQAAATRTAVASAKVSAETARAAVQQSRLTAEQTKASLVGEKLAQAQAKTALAQQKVATESAKTAEASARANIAYLREEEALNRAIAAEQRAITSKNQLAAATVKEAEAQQRATIIHDRNVITPSGNPGGQSAGSRSTAASQTQNMGRIPGIANSHEEAKQTDTKWWADQAKGIDNVGNSSKLAAHHAANLGYQLNDIFVSLASGQKPMMVFIQQGAQIGQIATASGLGMRGMASATLALLAPFAPLIAVLGVGAAGIAALTKQANDTSGLKKYTKEMGYSAAEVKKLNAVQVTFGDTFKAVFQVGAREVAKEFGMTGKDMAKTFKAALAAILSGTRATMAGVYALVAGTRSYLGELEKGGFKGLLNTMMGGNPDLLKNTYGKAYSDAQGFMDKVVVQARKNAKATQDEMAKGFYDPKKPKKEPKGWDRAQELKNTNAELDAQIALLGKYGDELDRANQLEQISKKFRDHNVPLTAAETAALEKKITTLQEGRRVQDAMTAADEAANGPSRKYQANIDALNNLLERGKISQDDYRAQMRLNERAFEDATNPLAALNRELQRNGELMGLYGRDRDVKSYVQQLEQAAEAQGKSIYKELPGRERADNDNGDIVVTGRRRSRELNDDAQNMVDKYKRQQQQEEYTRFFEGNDRSQKQRDPNDPSYVLDNYKNLYSELKRLRDADVISEDEAASRKRDLDRAYLDARLSNASTVLGQLSGLQQSKNREVAAFGKAAAMTQATIDGIAAVQAALRGPPGPPWSYAIAASTGVMAAANVAKIAGVGFMAGGYTGDMPTNQEAGVVHGREYVFDAAATSRIGVPALEAMRRGQSLSQPANNNGMSGPSMKIVAMPGTVVEERRTSTGEIEYIVDRMMRKKTGRYAADDLRKGANSDMGRAVGTGYGLQRADR